MIRDYLNRQQVRFEVVLHAPVPSAARLAGSAHVPGRGVAKSVLLKVGSDLVLAVLPATHRIDFDRLRRELAVSYVELASEAELERIFHDCQPGALPALGRAYGVRTVLDASMLGAGEILFGGNTQVEGVRMRLADYEKIEAPSHARFAEPITPKRSKPVRQRRRVG
ncbi:MAG: YbaK/EbsC family protein [Isosphaeraceae bacterium]